MAQATQRGRLSTTGVAARVVATALALGLFTYGQVAHTNDLFPFGVMGQYANAQVMNASVRSTFLEADVAGGSERVRVPLNVATVGVERSEIEGQLVRIVSHPELLGSLASAYHQLHPDRPELTQLYLQRSTRTITNGVVSDEETLHLLAEWPEQP